MQYIPTPDPLDHFWNLHPDDAFKNLSCSEKGLSDEEADQRIKNLVPIPS